MAVYRACYSSRYDVMSAPDIALTPDMARHVDSAISAAADDLDRLTHRRFWNNIETAYWDFPNYQRAYPWRLWFDERELADVTTNVPVVKSGGVVIPNTSIFWGHPNYSPPYTYLELDRTKSASFGQGSGIQRNISIAGTFGYWTQTRAGGALVGTVSSTSATTIAVSDSSLVDTGDVITVDSESMLVSDTAAVSTTQVQQGSGCGTAATSDVLLTVTDGTKFDSGEVVQLDGEMMLILSVTGNVLTVVRSWGGTVLATHSGATVYAFRTLKVVRGFGGTTAATHADAAPVTVARIPPEVHELAIAEALNYVYQKTSGYARTIGEGQVMVPGGSLPDLRRKVVATYGRTLRQRAV
jgi:hypothetical protein